MKKKGKNTYVIRKIIEAESLSEVMKMEPKVPPCEVILVIEADKEKRQFLPAIGFGPREPRPERDD